MPKRSFASRLFGYDIFLSFALGAPPANVNPYERNNLWRLHTALSMGPERVRFICLRDGKGGDGPGGTKPMHDSVKKRSGLVQVLDTNVLFKEGN
jgi:hypothetical protein